MAARPVAELHREYATAPSPALRAHLVERYQNLARVLARRYSRRGMDYDDVMQVALLGLLHAVDRFDPERGVSFATFAWATISGEIKRHYRQTRWPVHVTRRQQESYQRAGEAIDRLTQQLGRSPTVDEIARATGDSIEDVVASLEVGAIDRAVRLDSPAEDGGYDVPDGADDVAAYDRKDTLRFLLGRLPDRERQVVRLRFVDELTQAEIGERMGLSQMHVSRLLAQSMSRLRALAPAALAD